MTLRAGAPRGGVQIAHKLRRQLGMTRWFTVLRYLTASREFLRVLLIALPRRFSEMSSFLAQSGEIPSKLEIRINEK